MTLAVVMGLALGLPSSSLAAVFHCDAGDAACLINSINEANANGHANTIRLAAGTYTLSAPDNDTNGPNGLPQITSRLKLEGAGADSTTIVRASDAPRFRLMYVGPSGSLTIQGITLQGGSSLSGGSGIYNGGGFVNISHSVVTGNLVSGVGLGGGLTNAGGVVNVAHSVIAGNGATAGGGLTAFGVHSIVLISHSLVTRNGAFNEGGAVEVDGGTMIISRSTFAHNGAEIAGAIQSRGYFGQPITLVIADSAIVEHPSASSIIIGPQTTAIVTNTTVAHNTLQNIVSRSGNVIENAGTLVLMNGTVAENFNGLQPNSSMAALSSANTASSVLVNTILTSSELGTAALACSGPVTSLGHNIIDDANGCDVTLLSSDRTGDAGLGEFTDNGRPGNAHLPLLKTSQAIDAGDNAFCSNADQLGHERVKVCDIGAIEFQHEQKLHSQTDQEGEDSDDSLEAERDLAQRLLKAIVALQSSIAHHTDVSGQIQVLLDLATALVDETR
jgi:hypothetical protein